MLRISDMRRMCKAIAKVTESKMDEGESCPFCEGMSAHEETCEYTWAKSYLAHDKLRRMKLLAEMIERDLNVKVTMNLEGAIIDCDIN